MIAYYMSMLLLRTKIGIFPEKTVKFEPIFKFTVMRALTAPPTDARPELKISLKGSSMDLNGKALVPSSMLLAFEEGST